MLFGDGIPEMSPRPTLGGDVSWWWAPHPRFELGVATGLAMTVLPYGCSDHVPFIGERGQAGCGDALDDNVTGLPRIALGLRFLVGQRAVFGALLGTTFVIASGVEPDYFLYPYPTAGVFVDAKLGAARHFGLRASFSYIQIAYRESRGFFAPAAAFFWNERR